MYRKLGVRFDSVTLMLWNAKVFSETSPPQATVALGHTTSVKCSHFGIFSVVSQP